MQGLNADRAVQHMAITAQQGVMVLSPALLSKATNAAATGGEGRGEVGG